jgi:multiple sugar transport system permease protein
MNTPTTLRDKVSQSITPRRLRFLKESFTGYLFIAPALVLIFIFGLFPVAFALYVSVHKWRLVRTDFVGLNNFVRVVGNITYVAAFFLALGALLGAVLILRSLIHQARETNQKPWWLTIPSFLHALAVLAFFRYFWFQLPEFLDIATRLRGQTKTRDLFIRLLRDSFYAPKVYQAWQFFIWIMIGSILVGIAAVILYRKPQAVQYQTRLTLVWLSFVSGIGLLYFTIQQISAAYRAALEANSDPGIWPQVIVISAGMVLLVLGWLCWSGAPKVRESWKFWLQILGAFVFLTGGWILVGELPVILASGDKDLWDGLKVTLFFSAGTVPFQLTISLFLSILLFQKLRGSELFRMVFFLPYVTPFIASAAVFKQIFANRDTSPVNLVIRALGGEGLAWLQESKGVNLIIADIFGFDLPQWAAGPSLALVVVIIHSIWTYVGYDTVIYLAGLGNIPTELNEAAAIDGASRWDVFRFITFPLLSPTTYFLSLIAVIGTFKAFATLWVFREPLAVGTTNTFSVVIFIEFFEKLRYGYASAMAFVLFAIILGLTIINNRFQGSRVFFL